MLDKKAYMEKENEKIKEKAIDKDCYTKPQE
jgi:hypothetical protein